MEFVDIAGEIGGTWVELDSEGVEFYTRGWKDGKV